MTLEIVLGEPQPNGRTALADNLAALAKLGGPGLEDAPVGARPDLAAAEENEKQAETNLALQRRQRIPDVTVSVQYERNPPSQPNTVGLGLRLPLPLWNQQQRRNPRRPGRARPGPGAAGQGQDPGRRGRGRRPGRLPTRLPQRVQRYRTSLVPKSAQVDQERVLCVRKRRRLPRRPARGRAQRQLDPRGSRPGAGRRRHVGRRTCRPPWPSSNPEATPIMKSTIRTWRTLPALLGLLAGAGLAACHPQAAAPAGPPAPTVEGNTITFASGRAAIGLHHGGARRGPQARGQPPDRASLLER